MGLLVFKYIFYSDSSLFHFCKIFDAFMSQFDFWQFVDTFLCFDCFDIFLTYFWQFATFLNGGTYTELEYRKIVYSSVLKQVLRLWFLCSLIAKRPWKSERDCTQRTWPVWTLSWSFYLLRSEQVKVWCISTFRQVPNFGW